MIIDISQEVFSCRVYPGDPAPERRVLSSMAEGADYNLTALSLCAHNGTHVDAPFHFIRDGKPIDQVPLTKFIGPAWVESHTGDVTAEDARAMLARAAASGTGAEKRILVKGPATLTLEAAQVLAAAGIDLFGNESQTVGPEEAPAAVHLAFLGAEVVLLEGIRLSHVPEGAWLLNCAPLNLSGCDGSPCRAFLVRESGGKPPHNS
jgi:arylformamidase